MQKINNTCCFTGHRWLPVPRISDGSLTGKIKHAIKSLIENNNVDTFIAGGAIGFDMLAALTILEIKKTYPNIKLVVMLPCKNSDKLWREFDKQKQEYLLANADEIIHISQDYYSGCMHKRNREMIDNSQYCIAYLEKQEGGTFYTVNYAQQKGKTILNLANY